MIYGVHGKSGQGKGVLLAQMIERDLKRGIKVAANFQIEGAAYCPNFEDWIIWAANNRDSRLYIDEAEVVLGSREWSKIPQAFRVLVLQHRHIGLDMIWATVSPDAVDKSLRDKTHVFYRMKKVVPGYPKNPYPDGSYDLIPVFRLQEFEGYKPSQMKKAVHTRYFFYRSRWGGMYDAGQLVAPQVASKEALEAAMAKLLASQGVRARNIG